MIIRVLLTDTKKNQSDAVTHTTVFFSDTNNFPAFPFYFDIWEDNYDM